MVMRDLLSLLKVPFLRILIDIDQLSRAAIIGRVKLGKPGYFGQRYQLHRFNKLIGFW
jgi:hypothetical protein